MSDKPMSLADLGKFYEIPPGESEAEYFESLGRFIAAYANSEATVHELARFLSKMSEEKARVIFYGMRLGDLTDRIRAMLRADQIDTETCDEVESCLTQLATIADARNKLVHRTVQYAFGKLTVTNAYSARTREGIEFHAFLKTELEAMQTDCICIFARLLKVSRGRPEDLELVPFNAFLHEPWRYKPAQQVPRKAKRPAAPGLQKPPPDASPT
jgi:hypothetical protein